MATPELSTIAQLLYPDLQTLDFARIVAELEAVLSRLRDGEVDIAWDCDDLITFDVPETRILLAWAETGKRGMGGCLTVSVGPNPTVAGQISSKADHDVLCSRLVERIQTRFPPEGVLWHQVAGPVGSDYVDALIDTLPDVGAPTLPPIDTILDMLSRVDLRMADLKSRAQHPRSVRAPELSWLAMEPEADDEVRPVPMKPADVKPVDVKPVDVKPVPMKPVPMKPVAEKPGVTPLRLILLPEHVVRTLTPPPGFAEAANDGPDLPLVRNEELVRLRAALYPAPEVKAEVAVDVAYSTQMRLAAHCMNATLILVYAPLGAAVMTYSLLRGEDMRLSSRMMAVAGTLFAVAHSPVGQTMAAMAKGIV